MDLNEYQQHAMETCMPSCENISYMLFNLVGEVGELTSKVAKAIRKGQIAIKDNRVVYDTMPSNEVIAFIDGVKAEAGDCLWQLAGLCSVMGWSLDDIGRMNLDKLASRKLRGVIEGNGDNR